MSEIIDRSMGKCLLHNVKTMQSLWKDLEDQHYAGLPDQGKEMSDEISNKLVALHDKVDTFVNSGESTLDVTSDVGFLVFIDKVLFEQTKQGHLKQ